MMDIIDPHLFGIFLLTGLALNVTPGPDMLFVVAAGTSEGRRNGVLAALGIGTGGIVHTVAATAGLSALLASSATAFATVKYAGAAYLVYVGARILWATRSKEMPSPCTLGDSSLSESRGAREIFLRAVVTNILNPKVALFFLALVPQFVVPSRGSIALQFLILGVSFCATGTLVNSIVGLLAGSVRGLMTYRPGLARRLDRTAAVIFIGLGIRLALTDRS